ncbi:MAG: hypothetical protein JWP37_3705 [Mucilaginibacter sp.]|nr:hypothetical protein [Mucilaginibacter sp.]
MLWMALALNACKPEDQVNFTGVITFDHPDQETLVADGVTTLPIPVKIESGADPDKRTVTFTTDLGTFTNNTNTITIVAGTDNKATAYLKSVAQGTATIKATVSTFSITKTVLCTFSNVLFFANAATETLTADNYSLLKITGHINPGTDVALCRNRDRQRIGAAVGHSTIAC